MMAFARAFLAGVIVFVLSEPARCDLHFKQVGQATFLAEHVVPGTCEGLTLNREMLNGAMGAAHIREEDFAEGGAYHDDAVEIENTFRQAARIDKEHACANAWKALGDGGLTLLNKAGNSGPVSADATPREAKTAIRALDMAGAAQLVCPDYRVNMAEANSLAENFHLDPADINGRYSAFSKQMSDEYTAAVNKDRSAFCDMAWAIFGDHGKIPHVLERRN